MNRRMCRYERPASRARALSAWTGSAVLSSAASDAECTNLVFPNRSEDPVESLAPSRISGRTGR